MNEINRRMHGGGGPRYQALRENPDNKDRTDEELMEEVFAASLFVS